MTLLAGASRSRLRRFRFPAARPRDMWFQPTKEKKLPLLTLFFPRDSIPHRSRPNGCVRWTTEHFSSWLTFLLFSTRFSPGGSSDSKRFGSCHLYVLFDDGPGVMTVTFVSASTSLVLFSLECVTKFKSNMSESETRAEKWWLVSSFNLKACYILNRVSFKWNHFGGVDMQGNRWVTIATIHPLRDCCLEREGEYLLSYYRYWPLTGWFREAMWRVRVEVEFG